MAKKHRALKVVVVGNMAQSLVNFRGPLLSEMIKRGHQVVAVGPEHDARYANELRDIGVRYRTAPLQRASINPASDLRFLLSLRRILREERPDVFLGYTIKPVIYGNIAARLARVPNRSALITGLGYAFGRSSLKQRMMGIIVGLLYRVSLTGTKVVFFQNPDDRAEFVRRNYVSPSKSKVVAGSGVDLGRFIDSAPPPPPPTFLLIARLIREKGIELFAEAARQLKQRHPQARFQLLGPFDDNPTAIAPADVAAWERDNIIEYLGETDDVRPYLNAASVFVLPSYYREGTPRTALEALATGRPVVTTNAPGCRETVIDGVNGYLVEPRDIESLVGAMEKFIVKPELVISMGAESLQLAKRKYDVRLVNTEMLAHLEL